MKPTLKVTSDFTKQFNDVVKRFKNDDVLIGIPEDENARKDEDPPIGNAALLATASFGSAAQNIPAWPILAIGIRNAKEQIAEQFRRAAIESLSKGFSALDTYYNRAGIIASVACKKVINDQEGVPEGKPEDSTLKARKASGHKGTKYWLVTGQMRNSITYVLRTET